MRDREGESLTFCSLSHRDPAMAREPVAIDFIGLGERRHVTGLMGSAGHGGHIDDERVGRVATRLVRPVPSVPECAMSRMSPVSEGFRNWSDTRVDNAGANTFFARPGAAGDISSPPSFSSSLAFPTSFSAPKHLTP